MEERYGIVYFFGPKDTGAVKIGYTSSRDPAKRLAQLQTGSAETLIVLGTINGGPLVERTIHGLLAAHRVRGEWFERAAALAVLSHLNEESRGPLKNEFAIALADATVSLDPDEDEQQSLAARVAADLVRDRVNDILTLPIGKPIPFRAWLDGQKERDDPTGDLAKDMSRDQGFPALGTLEEYLAYITGRMSNVSVTRAVFDAWVECLLAIKGLPFRTP